MHGVGILAIVLAIAYIVRPVPHIPPYDANLVRLAESQRQGYCSGETFWKTQGTGNAAIAASCRRQKTGMSDQPNMGDVPLAFCTAIVDAGWDGDVPTCLDIMVGNQLWPTYDGSITDQWNRARPYPLSALPVVGPPPDSSRTGGHEGPVRNPIGR